jgi:ketosteroid isomerase-like protein
MTTDEETPMTDVTTAPAIDPALRAIRDRLDITDTLYRYASTIDRFDWDGLRSVLADDLVAQYGNADPVHGGDAVAEWIGGFCADVEWQHHLLSVYHVEIDGDDAKALVYHTSHQMFRDDPNAPKLLVGRYHNELRREPDGWKISRLLLEIGWGETKADDGYLEAVGGRGPAV